ncbi:MAG: endonuclease/exonuclease/phosphatase family protein [Gemmatimonadales bacterium]|nr:endonuclease/exonuclease/phosphatase family protein [Gemmatimonadales bacterium]MDZ4390879.1 endonuclease/exonuclease/phosphatase family protein [Gemmatimonadales bacterium]
MTKIAAMGLLLRRTPFHLSRFTFMLCPVLLGATTVAAQSPLRALSFNIRYGTANDGDHAWVNRRAHVITTIRDHAPHLLGIQEALRFQLDEIATAMPGYRVVGVGRDDGVRAGEYSAILVDTARFAVIDEGTFWYSDTPTVPGSMHWGNRITRIATWARLVDRATGDTIRFYNTHWDHESQPSRQRSAALLLDRIATDSAPNDAILVMGDFNADEVNPAFTALLADRRVPLRESFRERHPDATVVGTFNGFKGDSTGGMIDHILVGPGWRVLDAGIDRRRFGALWASDHFAVRAGLEREKERKRE